MMVRNFHPPFWPASANPFVIRSAIALLLLGGAGLDTGFAQSPTPPAKPGSPTGNPRQNSARPILKVGSQGEAVNELQAMLKLMGYYAGSVNGQYDETTAAAVTQFQKVANLSTDGVVGVETWNRLLPPAPAVATTASPPSSSAASPPATAESFPLPSGTKPSGTGAKPTPATTKPPTTSAASSPGGDRSSSQEAALPILRVGMKGPAVEGLQQRLQALGFLKGSVDGVFGMETQAAVKAAQRNLKLEPDGVVGQATWLGLLR
ncbi:MAG: peptidoglycan-binding domain-containing protein [Leptolyngbyaceae cyanobacterium bins.349]|nr:peptidoglycan-binding domain-containing protein [Leptolyngbyaceae cyanobacterium bins.349]